MQTDWWWNRWKGVLQGDGDVGSSLNPPRREVGRAYGELKSTRQSEHREKQLEDWEMAVSGEWESGTERVSQRSAVCHCQP